MGRNLRRFKKRRTNRDRDAVSTAQLEAKRRQEMIRKRSRSLFSKARELSEKTGISVGLVTLDECTCRTLIASQNDSWMPSFTSLIHKYSEGQHDRIHPDHPQTVLPSDSEEEYLLPMVATENSVELNMAYVAVGSESDRTFSSQRYQFDPASAPQQHHEPPSDDQQCNPRTDPIELPDAASSTLSSGPVNDLDHPTSLPLPHDSLQSVDLVQETDNHDWTDLQAIALDMEPPEGQQEAGQQETDNHDWTDLQTIALDMESPEGQQETGQQEAGQQDEESRQEEKNEMEGLSFTFLENCNIETARSDESTASQQLLTDSTWQIVDLDSESNWEDVPIQCNPLKARQSWCKIFQKNQNSGGFGTLWLN